MSPHRAFLIPAILLLAAHHGITGPDPDSIPLLTGAGLILASTRVPSRVLAQGEVRVIRRQSTPLVQTVLHTRFLDRVTGSIEKKELRNWPDERPGARSSRDYLAALARARAVAAAQQSPIHTLVIEIVPKGTNSYAAFFQASVDPTPGDTWNVTSLSLIEAIPLSPMYAEDNALLIIDDTFGRDAESVRKTMEAP